MRPSHTMLLPLLLLFLSAALCQDAGDTNWLDAAPGVAMEYKVHVDAAKEDCYYQYVHPGATLYVSYQVLKGGDGAIGFAVRNPAGKVVHPYQWKATSEYEQQATDGGYYSFCLDNQVRDSTTIERKCMSC